jgi:hypothetical protein
LRRQGSGSVLGHARFAVVVLWVAALAGCSSAQAAAAHRTPSPSASPTYDDAGACQAFQAAMTIGVPPAIESPYQGWLTTFEYVTDASRHADPHLQALIQQWSDDDEDMGLLPSYYGAFKRDVKAVAAWCAKQGDQVTLWDY